MAKIEENRLVDYIEPLNMNGLRGRVLNAPPRKKSAKRQILLIYGHHASIERMLGFAEELTRYGTVTVPDLPGFGGMESFYKIGVTPTIDANADYLAAFIKMRYKNRRVTIAAMSFGFVVVTRMLQKYPELAKKVDDLISIVGFVHHEDFKMKSRTKFLLRTVGQICTNKVPAILTRYILLSRPVIYAAYLLVGERNVKMREASFKERMKRIDFEVELWQSNDVRTYAYTGKSMLSVDLFKGKSQVDIAVTHVEVTEDRYFDNRIVEQHFGVIFRDVNVLTTKLKGHAPTVIATAEDAAPFIPRKLRSILKST